MSRSAARRLSVAELAKREGVSPRTIRRRLRKLDESNKGRVVLRNSPGNERSPMYTTLTALERVDRRLVEQARVDADRVAILEETVRELRRTVSSVRSALRAAHEAIEELVLAVESRSEADNRGHNSGRV